MLVLVHGLCMNDLQWARDGHEHGEALARDLGYTPIYLHYNTGLHISANGRQFADLMEAVLHEWPHPIERLTLIGHSMGGLVARSACHYASLAAHAWVKRLDDLIFLGTPHLGAPLERAGTRVDWVIGMSPYTAPLARLGRTRSAGINDLGHGYLLDEDWQAPTKSRPSRGRPVPLPASVKCYAVAASKQRRPDARRAKMRGDGFVPVESALGRHRDPSLELDFPDPHRWVGFGMSHFDLLSRRDMYEKIRFWLGETYVRPKSTAAKSGHALGALG
jgi:pimeloyl-ACP methyl ester carboxylesterase